MPDHELIKNALVYLDKHFQDQPTVGELAANAGLSESQFHRVFVRWAEITPKRFLEFVTATHARRMLVQSATVLEAASASGLSGGGRLHDLFVSIDGVTPGDIARSGQGLSLRYGVHESPFGNLLIAESDRGVNALSFLGTGDLEIELAALEDNWPKAQLIHDPHRTAETTQRIIAGLKHAEAPCPRIMAAGTNFQIRVWEALLRIPPGHMVTYSQVAKAAGRPDAVRAVGTAIGQNPVPLLIPCHRVIRGTGAFGHYSGGAWRKQAILAWESQRADPDRRTDAHSSLMQSQRSTRYQSWTSCVTRTPGSSCCHWSKTRNACGS